MSVSYRPSRLGVYNGIDDPTKFIQDFEIHAINQDWDETKQLTVFPKFLEGRAKRVFDACTDKSTIAKAIDAVKKGCKPPNESLLYKFYDRKLKPGEKISHYALHLQELLLTAMPDISTEYMSTFLRSHLNNALPADLRSLVNFTADTLTWDQLLVKLDQQQCGQQPITLSQSYESYPESSPLIKPEPTIKSEPIESYYAESNKSTRRVTLRSPPPFDRSRLGASNFDRSRLGQPSVSFDRSRLGQTSANFDGECNYCHIWGHKMSDCRKRAQVNSQSNRRYQEHNRGNRRYDNHGHNSRHRNNRPQVNSNAVSADKDEFTGDESGYPYLELNTATVVSLKSLKSGVEKSVGLLRIQVEFSLFNGSPVTVNALLDGGSSHSFISPRVLTEQQKRIASDPSQCSRENYVINGATGTVKCQCSVSSAFLRLDTWKGSHKFIITAAVHKDDMILGRDFLKANAVKIDHSTDSLKIGSCDIVIPTTNTFKSSTSQSRQPQVQSKQTLVRQSARISADQSKLETSSLSFVCKTTTDVIVPQQSQTFVPFTCANINKLNAELLLFEPLHPTPSNCLIARSVHQMGSQLYCNVLNAGPVDIRMQNGMDIGQISETEAANREFDKNVRKYRPLSMEQIRGQAKSRLSGKSPRASSDRWNNLSINKELTALEREMLLQVLDKHQDTFQWDSSVVGRTKLVEHTINTGDSKPVQLRQYPLPSVALAEVRRQRDDMLKTGIIRPSNSPWRSPVLLIKKKDSGGAVVGHRFCIDLTKVNEKTVKDSYPLPLIGKTVNTLSGSKYFSSADLDRAFWQIGIAEQDKQKFAFVVDNQLFEPNVMPFGATNAPSTFQRLIDRVLHGLTWRQCLVYLDDVLIFSKTFEEHLEAIHEVLSRLDYAGLKLKPSKCNFVKDEVDYLGFKVSQKGIQVTPKKIEALLKVPLPETNKKLYTFLCSLTYYRTCIPKYGDLTSDLYAMCDTKKKLCQWNEKTTKQFTALKQALVQAPILAYPDYSEPFVVHSDASDIGISAVLLQYVDKVLKPISFASRKLSLTERRYTVSERELLAIVYAYEQFYHHLYGRTITFFTDHKPLVTMNKLKKPLGRLGRLFHRLSGVDYSLEYIPGAQNFLADFLSRSFNPDTVGIEVKHTAVQSSVNWLVEQAKDPELVSLIECVRNSSSVPEWRALSNGGRWLLERRNLYLDEGILMHSTDRVVVPDHMKKEVMKLHHDSPFAGHRAFETTLISLNKRYYWNFMPSQVKDYCTSCEKCQKFNFACAHNRAPLKPIVVSRPWQLLGIDFTGPLKTTPRGKKYIVIAVDHFTKYVEAAATTTFDAQTTALFTFNNIICRYGMVESILTDQGVNFESKLFKHLCTLLGTDKLHTSTYHPEANGCTERINRTMKPGLAKYVNVDHDDWDLYLQMAVSAYNNSYHASIRMTPYEAMFGRPPVLVCDVIMNNQLPSTTRISDVSSFIKFLRLNADYVCSIIRKNSDVARARQKANYDNLARGSTQFNEGDLVKINNFRVRPGHSKSFEPKFLGPYRIVSKFSNLNYEIDSNVLPREIVHYNRMSLFTVPTTSPEDLCPGEDMAEYLKDLSLERLERGAFI